LRKASLQLARPRKEKHNYGKRRNHLGPRNDCRYMCAANWVTVACSCSPTGSRTVTFARVSRVDAVIPTSGLVTALQPVLRGAQRTYGTTDPGGVWHPHPSQGMLNNPLGTYAENDKSTTDDLHCIRYSLLMPCASASVPTDWYLRVEKQSTTPVQAWLGSFRLSETGTPCTKGFFFAQVFLCPVSVFKVHVEPVSWVQ